MDNSLRDVTVVSVDDLWAIGLADVRQEGGRQRTVILHWDGTRWVAVRHPTRWSYSFTSISGDAPDDVWIVGYARDGAAGLAEHWDGTAWRTVELADPGTHFFLKGVFVVAPDDVWAAGVMVSHHRGGGLIEHWDGTAWSVVPNPASEARSASLEEVSGSASDDVWAVGVIGGSRLGRPSRGLLEHWDGSAWHLLHGPRPPVDRKRSGWFFGVAAASSTDVWAVGASNPHPGWIGGRGSRQLIEHWNGSRWTVVPAAMQSTAGILNGVAVSTTSGLWTVGQTRPFYGSALAERWDGSVWVPESTVGPHSTSFLSAVATDPSGELWAVGGIGWRHQRNLAMRCV